MYIRSFSEYYGNFYFINYFLAKMRGLGVIFWRYFLHKLVSSTVETVIKLT